MDSTQDVRSRRGFCLWMTGLSGAGKSTLAELTAERLKSSGLPVEVLDADAVRANLAPDLGFSKADRDENVRRLGWVASRLVRVGAVVIVAAISPYREARAGARRLVEEHGPFLEVFVDAPLEVCSRRDVKGLYARARAGDLRGFTGIDDPYEQPPLPDVHVDSARLTAEEGVHRLIAAIDSLELLAGNRSPRG